MPPKTKFKTKFKRDTTPVTGKPGGEPPPWAVVTMIGIIAMVVLIFTIGQWDDGATLRRFIPFADSGYFYPGADLLADGGDDRADDHQQVGRFQQSQALDADQRPHRAFGNGNAAASFSDEAETIVNAPAVEYEFEVGGRTMRGSRIGIGDDWGGANSEATLARYPVGAAVTVYYDPNDPKSCVLERGGPLDMKDRKTLKGCAGGLLILALLGGAIWWLITHGPAFVKAQFPKSEPELVVFVSCFGLALLLFFIGMFRYQRRATQWPWVTGRVVASAVESYQERSTSDSNRTSTMYRPVVEFAYSVHGRDYHSKQIKLMTEVSGSQSYAEKISAKYPKGSEVNVHYDPADPGTAALENPTGMAFIVLVAALAMFALAAWKTGIFEEAKKKKKKNLKDRACVLARVFCPAPGAPVVHPSTPP